MAKDYGRRPRHSKNVNLALQGGGAHGAFTWGVLDYIFEQDKIWVEALSGTSAGAMNAVVAAQGMYENGAQGARDSLTEFWREVSKAGRTSPIQRSPVDRLMGNWSLDTSPGYVMMDLMSRMVSPYDLNPLRINPLRDLVAEFVDFNKVRDCHDMQIYLSATNVNTGRARIFDRQQITLDVVMASACLPSLYHAVEIDGVPYWDGGFMGNPVLLPFVEDSPADDIVIIQVNPKERSSIPTSAREIQNRVNEITFNSSLQKELRMIDVIQKLAADGEIGHTKYSDLKLHLIEATEEMKDLGASSKLNAEWDFLLHLHDIGRRTAETWLDQNFECLGKHSTLALPEMFEGTTAERCLRHQKPTEKSKVSPSAKAATSAGKATGENVSKSAKPATRATSTKSPRRTTAAKSAP